jgi:adenine phosphoribosyltransferase
MARLVSQPKSKLQRCCYTLTMPEDPIKAEIIREFEFVDGHSDLWRLFYDGVRFQSIVGSLADPFGDAQLTKVVGIEAKGFILGAAVAAHLGVGFVAIRKPGGLYPGPKLERITEKDYRGNHPILRLQMAAVTTGDRLLLVDDWLQTGSQALAAKAMLQELGGILVGCSIIVDQLPGATREKLGRVHSILAAHELNGSSSS